MSRLVARWQVALSAGALLAAPTFGCSGSEADSEWVSQDHFPERYASLWCEAVAACCGDARIAYDPAICDRRARDFAASLLENHAARDSSYSPKAGTLCLGRLEQALGACEIEEASSACSMIFVGSSPDGAPCANGSECTSGYCALSEAGLGGVCSESNYVAPSHGRLGERCVGSCGVPGSFECPTSLLPSSDGTITYCYAEDGLYCTFDPELLEVLTCQPYRSVGDSCATDQRCAPGAFCSDGTCVAQQAAGPCRDTPDLCDNLSYCDSNQQCQAKHPDGAACFSGEECASSSCSSDGQSAGLCDSGNSLLARACTGAL